jgi:hypothetical protein
MNETLVSHVTDKELITLLTERMQKVHPSFELIPMSDGSAMVQDQARINHFDVLFSFHPNGAFQAIDVFRTLPQLSR